MNSDNLDKWADKVDRCYYKSKELSDIIRRIHPKQINIICKHKILNFQSLDPTNYCIKLIIYDTDSILKNFDGVTYLSKDIGIEHQIILTFFENFEYNMRYWDAMVGIFNRELVENKEVITYLYNLIMMKNII